MQEFPQTHLESEHDLITRYDVRCGMWRRRRRQRSSTARTTLDIFLGQITHTVPYIYNPTAAKFMIQPLIAICKQLAPSRAQSNLDGTQSAHLCAHALSIKTNTKIALIRSDMSSTVVLCARPHTIKSFFFVLSFKTRAVT